MELLSTEDHFILVDKDRSLWINKRSQTISAKIRCADDVNATCLGIVYGYLGKLKFGAGFDTRLVFIRQKALVGVLDGCEIYKILSVVSIPLESEVELILEGCPKHGHSVGDPNTTSQSVQQDSRIRTPAFIEYTGQKNLFKLKAVLPLPLHTEKGSPVSKKNDRIDKVEKRIVEEFHKMFTDADSFYYSATYDLTNSIQRQFFNSEKNPSPHSIWTNADDRFIWNYHMLSDLLQSEDPDMYHWAVPIVHGFVEYGRCELELDQGPPLVGMEKRDQIELWLISRRSRFRAGTRYLRRGIDEHGKVANYVETEQIMIFQKHKTSFVQVRGSIPLFWSQSSQRYRPAPQIDRLEEESFAAFQKHFKEEISLYGPVVIVNLVDKTGKEKILGDTFLSHVLMQDSSDITYLSFDFHEHCRGMHFENVSIVINKLEDTFNSLSYCWIDSYGIVLKQNGVIRVNCVDCLDRTNLTQTQFGRHVLETQLSKLGLLAPEIGLAKNIRVKLQAMWANNGDTISKQYAGTNALKGDFTRTGERKLTSALKDGMNSANRYYLNRFRDAHRQAAIDMTMGERKTLSVDELDDGKVPDEKEATIEQIRTVIEDAKKCVIPEHAIILGAWGFVNAKKNDPGDLEVDTVFILTEEACFTTEYDCSSDSLTETEMFDLQAVTSIELGFEKTTQSSNLLSFFSHSVSSSTMVPCLRINYSHNGESHCHEFMSSNIIFYNNSAAQIQHPEEMLEALRHVATVIQQAAKNANNPVKFCESKFLPDQKISSQAARSSNSLNLETKGSELGANLPSKGQVLGQQHAKFIPLNFRGQPDAEPQLARVRSLKYPKREGQALHLSIPLTKIKHDFVLPSCGILSYYSNEKGIAGDHKAKPEERFSNVIPTVKSNFEISNGLRTPVAATTPLLDVVNDTFVGVLSEPLPTESPEEQPHQTVLFRHRLSLPVNAIPLDFSTRSITPEIKITKATQNTLATFGDASSSDLRIPTMNNRMSRSTEEIPNELETAQVQDASNLGSQKLSPTFSKDNRSSSIQNLFNTTLNMKSSRSENAILARPVSARMSAMNPLSKESVLVPLGKLARGVQKGANYFDPRKLKETFKANPRREAQEEIQRKEDREYFLALEEKKKKCKSVIIEI